MLESAIKASIPIISARTSDLLNLEPVMKNLAAPASVKRFSPGDKMLIQGTVYYAYPGYFPDFIDPQLYMKLSDHDCVLVLVNREEATPIAFDAGEVPVPKVMLEEALAEVVGKDAIPTYIRYVTGLTLKQVLEVIRIAQVRHGPLTPQSLMSTRTMLIGATEGLQQVQATSELYLPPTELSEWIELNRDYFLTSEDGRLVPRGILFHGVPGVGKTMGAKHIAREFGVPLYRLELSSALGRYVGESEGKVSRVLSAVDQEEPCVLLIDEVEKLFAGKDDSGVTSRILSQILWWSAEHESRVLTVMTTNNIDAIPPELYRAGRIDRTVEIERLRITEANRLGQEVLKRFLPKPTAEQVKLTRQAINASMDQRDKKIAHAEVTQAVHELIKTHHWKEAKV